MYLYVSINENDPDNMMMLNYLETEMQIRIPPELKQIRKTVVPITGIEKAPDMEHHDPSNIIRYQGRYYVWYTEHSVLPEISDGFVNCWINLATSEDGLHWQVQGPVLTAGDAGGPDELGVLTSYVVPAEGKYWMFFLAVDGNWENPQVSLRGIWLAKADTPNGPWHKHLESAVIMPDTGEWDALCCDDPNVIWREGKWWLYYKGRVLNSHPMDSFTGVAHADKITGPWIKHPLNPLMTGHAASQWVHRNGVAAIGGEVDAPGERCVRWSEDGLHFVEAGVFDNKSTGFDCPENFGDGKNMRGVTWGFDVMPTRPRYIYRFDCTMGVEDG